MGHKYTKEQIVAGALAVAYRDGLSGLSFGTVAAEIGIKDRTVVYYLPTKHDLIASVLAAVGAELQQTLAAAFDRQHEDHRSMASAAWPLLATEDADPVFALFFEAAGLAASGREPYRTIARQLVKAWIDWAAQYFTGTESQCRAEAEAAVALIDGLLLLRQLQGPEAANRAAALLTIGGV